MKIKTIKLLLILIFTSSFAELYSQVYINGSVTNINGDPIELASIQLLFDSKYHQSSISDSLGYYSLKSTLKGDCELMLNRLGYAPSIRKLNFKNDTVINIILKQDSLFINEVTILGQRDLIQPKADGYIVNIKGNINTEGKETADLLKQLPTLNVSDESINIFGKSFVKIYINDRLVRLSGQSLVSYLNSFPPDIIKSVEIMSTPPAEYDAEGNMGIIKINTDKNIQPGWKEFFKAGGIKNSYTSYMLSTYVNYIGRKFFFEGNISNGSYTYLNQSEYYNYFPQQTTASFNPKKWNSSSTDIQTSLGYNFNDRSTIFVDFQAPIFNEETIDDMENYTSFSNNIVNKIDSVLYSNGKTINNKYTYSTELFFKHLFADNKSYFTSSIAYLNNYSGNKRAFSSFAQVENTKQTTENYYTEGDQNYNILTSKLDFSFPVMNWNIKTGVKLSFINTNSESKFSSLYKEPNFTEPLLHNKYNYTENVQSIYYSMEKNISNWYFKGGIRSEFTNTKVKSIVLDKINTNKYIKFFPSLYFSHKLNNGSRISLSYAKRLERPPYKYLDPFKWYISKYDYAVGNPYLKPSDISNLEFSYTINSTFITKLYYMGQTDKIGNYVVLDPLNIRNQIQQADNFMNENSFGLNVYKFLKFKNTLETVIQADIYYSEYNTNRKEFKNSSGMGSTLIINNTIFINKNFQFVLNMEERLPGLYNYRNMHNYYRLDAGLNYINRSRGFELRLFAGDVLKSANPEYYYSSGGVKQIYKNYLDTQLLKLVVSWRLGNWFSRTPRSSKSSNVDEKRRL
ncbi:outer membrane beta-barrel protein [Marinifilum sp.]|uniref:outer membrane beta-barrel protein n=1 Tax=Marinifilum sp. TaxID=2033137 RepID=UPI003BAD00A3